MIVPTPRLLIVALFGLVPIALSSSHDLALIVAVVYLLGIGLIGAVDAWSAPPEGRLTWNRDYDSKLSLGVWNLVTLTLRNRSRRPAHFRVRDAVPNLFIVAGASAQSLCPPGGSWDLTYRVLPLHRGKYVLGPLTARYRGVLGLVWRQHTHRLDGSVNVYPNLLAVRSYESGARRGQLEEFGLRTSRRWGTGTEFERLREYTADDEYRRINWPATARLHRPIAVDYQTERSQTVMLVVDAGRLMSTRLPLDPATGGASTPESTYAGAFQLTGDVPALTRLDFALNAALLLAFVSQLYGDRVGLLAFGDRVLRYVAPGPGRGHFLQLTQAMYDLEPEGTETDFTVGLGYLGVRNRRRSLVVIFTDITQPEAASPLLAQVGHLRRRHLPLVVALRDPSIEALASHMPDSSDAVYQRAVARSLLDDRNQTLLRLNRLGALTLDVSADKLSPSLINRYLEIKARSAL